MPKLGFRDQLLYITALLLTFGGALGTLIVQSVWADRIAFADDRAVAATSGPGAWSYLCLLIWFLAVGSMILAGPYQNRYPIFGIRHFKYGPPAYPRIYPLLMKNKPKFWVSPKETARKRKGRVILAVVLAVALVFSLAMFPRSVYGRAVLLEDGTVEVFDAHNRETAHYKFSDLTAVELDTYRTSGGRYSNRDWTFCISLTFSHEETFSFNVGSFRGGFEDALRAMIALKERYGSLVTISGTENVWKVLRDRYNTETEADLLYTLFGMKGQ